MRRTALVLALLLSGSYVPALAQAQLVGVSGEFGTLGLGARAAVTLGSQFRLRAGGAFQPFRIGVNASDIVYDVTLATPSATGTLDWHPGATRFRFSGGVVYFAEDLEIEATPREDVSIGNQEYAPEDIGELIGNLGTEEFAPYFGLGWGDSTRRAVSFQLDFGFAFHGTPDVTLRATGPAGSDPGFQNDLNDEIADLNDEIDRVRAYPVLSLGVGVGL
jgi:hypothetical protein